MVFFLIGLSVFIVIYIIGSFFHMLRVGCEMSYIEIIGVVVGILLFILACNYIGYYVMIQLKAVI